MKKNGIFGQSSSPCTHLYEGQVANHLTPHLTTSLPELAIELDAGPLQGDGEGTDCLGRKGEGASDPGGGTILLGDRVGQVVEHLVIGCDFPWVEVLLVLEKGSRSR